MSGSFEIYRSRVKRFICIYNSGNFIAQIVIVILTNLLAVHRGLLWNQSHLSEAI